MTESVRLARRVLPKTSWPDGAAFRRAFAAAPPEDVEITIEPKVGADVRHS